MITALNEQETAAPANEDDQKLKTADGKEYGDPDTSLDGRLLSKLLHTGDLATIHEEGVTAEMLDKEAALAFQFIRAFHVKYGCMPGAEAVASHVFNHTKNIYWYGANTPEPLEFYCDEVLKRHRHHRLWSHLSRAQKADESNDQDGIEDALQKALSEITQGRQQEAKSISLHGYATAFTDYKDRKKQGVVDGIPSPWPIINEATRGLHPGELWAIIARMKLGKTFLLCHLGQHYWKQGRSVLLVSAEMSPVSIRHRLVALALGLPYSDYRKGRLPTPVEVRFGDAMKLLTDPGMPPFEIVGRDRVRRPLDISGLIPSSRPDVVLLDGAYLLHANHGTKSKWEKVAGVIEGLQEVAQQTQTPIVITSQFNRQVRKNRITGSANEVAFAYEIGQCADALFSISQNQMLQSQHQMLFRLLECRDGEPIDVLLNWNLDTMDFGEIGEVDAAMMRAMEGKGGEDDDIVDF